MSRNLADPEPVVDTPPVPQRPLWHAVVSGALTVLLLAVLALAVALGVVPRMMGGQALAVLTGSMQPTYAPGDMVVSVPQDRYVIGDVVTFQPRSGDPTLVTHRIVGVHAGSGPTRFVTRGDANGADDAGVEAAQIKGKVIYSVPYIGHLSTDGDDRRAVVVLAGAALIGLAIYLVGGTIHDNRRARRRGGRPDMTGGTPTREVTR